MNRISMQWERRFLELAEHVSKWSKDPSTKVGAVIIDADKRVVGLGYNGFPRGVNDTAARYAERAEKYPRVVHAEMNAILNATGSVKECGMFTYPLNTCDRCAAMVIQAGIRTVYATPNQDPRWADQWNIAKEMYEEAGVRVYVIWDERGDDD
jgi:dCMP deaminase